MSDVVIDDVDLDELAEVVLETLDGILATMGEGVEVPMVPATAATVIEAVVPVLGAASGQFTVRVSESVAKSLAVMWMGLEIHEVSTVDACDAVAEFCNMLAGSAKTLVSAETALDVPRVEARHCDEVHHLANSTEVFHDLGVFVVDFSA
ncbi:MAG: chemotaxis protein CheX [Acidimicrobiales bacterium]